MRFDSKCGRDYYPFTMSKPRPKIVPAVTSPVEDEEVAAVLRVIAARGCSVAAACRAVNPARNPTVLTNLIRSKPLTLAVKVEEAREAFRDSIRNEIRRRGLEGVDEPVFYQGEICGYVKRYSDAMLATAARLHLAEYTDRKNDLHVSGTVARDEPGRWSITADQALRLPRELRDYLILILRWVKSDRALQNASMIEADSVEIEEDDADISALPAPADPYDLAECAALFNGSPT